MSFLKEFVTELRRARRPAAGREKPLLMRTAWFFVNVGVVHNRVNPFSQLRVLVLRAFGAEVGDGVVLRPGVRVKFPWKLNVGDGASIGEDVWIDNIEHVDIGARAVVSQGVYFCTGNHDWTKPEMPLNAKPIRIEERAWVGARSVIGPGVVVDRNAIVRLGSVVTKDVPAATDEERWGVRRGVHAAFVRKAGG